MQILLSATAARPRPWVARCAAWLLAWRHARRLARPERLDDAALRDLGLARCELDSIGYEAAHPAERTRRRIAEATHASC